MIDLEKPMHFTKEQSEWIKQYVILKRKEERAEVIDKFNEIDNLPIQENAIKYMMFKEWLKEQK